MNLTIEPEYPETGERDYTQWTIRSTDEFRIDGGVELSVPDGGMIFYGADESDIRPAVGDVVRVYPKCGLGTQIRGIFINGKCVRYKTKAQSDYEFSRWRVRHHNERKEKFLANRERMDATFDALPYIFKDRIRRFRNESPDFRWDSEDYEVFCCTEAVKIAAHLRERAREVGPVQAVKEFHDLPWAEQSGVVDDGHSGNTFGGACALARELLRHELGEAVAV